MQPEGVEGRKKQFHASESIYIYTCIHLSVCEFYIKRERIAGNRKRDEKREKKNMSINCF
jgi:hypothetical protein